MRGAEGDSALSQAARSAAADDLEAVIIPTNLAIRLFRLFCVSLHSHFQNRFGDVFFLLTFRFCHRRVAFLEIQIINIKDFFDELEPDTDLSSDE